MKQLSKYQKAKIAIQVIEQLKEIPNKHIFYVDGGESEIIKKIAKKAKIDIIGYRREAGNIDISEYIILIYENIEDRWVRKLNGDRQRSPNHGIRMFPDFNVGEELIQLTKEFEEKQIPGRGPSNTLIGELFRAIQYIQYRAHNDGDYPWLISSPSFMSYMFLISQIDQLTYSSASYNEETGRHEFQFTNEFIKENSYDGQISTIIEHSLALDADFIKFQLMDLLLNGKIKNQPNKWDSRDYKLIKE